MLKEMNDAINEYAKTLEAYCQRTEPAMGLSTGIDALDEKLGGFQEGNVILLGGRPGMGKPFFAMNCAYNIATKFKENAEKGLEQKYVLYLSCLTTAANLVQRMVCFHQGAHLYEFNKTTDKAYNAAKNDELFDMNLKICDKLKRLPIYFQDQAHTFEDYIKTILEFPKSHKIGFVVIEDLSFFLYEKNADYLSMLETIRSVARCLNVPILVVAPLTRAVENRNNKRPTLSDFRYMSERDLRSVADVVLLLYRESFYHWEHYPELKKNETEEHLAERLVKWNEYHSSIENKCEIIVAQNNNGLFRCVIADCLFSVDTGKFSDLEEYDD